MTGCVKGVENENIDLELSIEHNAAVFDIVVGDERNNKDFLQRDFHFMQRILLYSSREFFPGKPPRPVSERSRVRAV